MAKHKDSWQKICADYRKLLHQYRVALQSQKVENRRLTARVEALERQSTTAVRARKQGEHILARSATIHARTRRRG